MAIVIQLTGTQERELRPLIQAFAGAPYGTDIIAQVFPWQDSPWHYEPATMRVKLVGPEAARRIREVVAQEGGRMSKTAHEKYEEQVANGVWRPYDDAQMAAKQRQIDGVIAERDALAAALAAKTERVAGLLEERAVLREKLTDARATAEKWRRAYTGDIMVSIEEASDERGS